MDHLWQTFECSRDLREGKAVSLTYVMNPGARARGDTAILITALSLAVGTGIGTVPMCDFQIPVDMLNKQS